MKLFVAIDSLPNIFNPQAKKIVLFLPEWELHEIGLLTYYYLAKKHGFKVYYLGQNVPLYDLFAVSSTIEPDIIATYFVSAVNMDELKDYIEEITSYFQQQHLLISGIQAAGINFPLPNNARTIASAMDFKRMLKAFD